MRPVIAIGSLALTLGVSACTEVPNSGPDVSVETPPQGGFFAALRAAPATEAATQSNEAPSADPAESIAVAGGDIVLAGPDGYCVDEASVATRGAQTFALLASCHIMSDGRSGVNIPPALITVSIGGRALAPTVPNPSSIAAAANTALLDTRIDDNLSLAYLESGGKAYLPNGSEAHWRAATVINRRLVGLALYTPESGGVNKATAAQLLIDTITQMSTQSPSLGTTPTPQSGESLLSRLFKR